MSKTQKPTKNLGGRPKADTAAITLRLHRKMIEEIDEFRRNEKDLPNRPEAIRRILAKYFDITDDPEGAN
jgi:metal-responsive CopG/Arc/MetJ family transcriptional regulator